MAKTSRSLLSYVPLALILYANSYVGAQTSASNTPNAISNATQAQNSSSTADGSSSISALTATAIISGKLGVSGKIDFALLPSNAVQVTISATGLMALNSTASYTYHIHTNPVSSDGNCTSALGHLDPLNVTEGLVCDPAFSQYCQLGDLGGRNGKLSGAQQTATATYTDNFLRFWPQAFSLLGRSVVIHLPNSTRIACGNITSVVDGTASSDGKPTLKSSNYTTQYATQGPPAPLVKYEPFVGSTPNDTVISTIILPSVLPDTKTLPNVILGTNSSVHFVNGTNITVQQPAALPAPSTFNYSPGAQLPSQQDPTFTSANSSSSGTRSVASQRAANSGNQLRKSTSLVAVSGLIFLAGAVVYL
ncbi:hypothetical protein O181_001560 [Austropuccinia psidii MF-1]|uniref:superoxide dismutase n=1 Tax=Austropuccinia psidii MF-1 TaxID=1389203 RepID=A0A9Q3GBY3_9BASI|nr:hypothetical protein [Austropuccinia psidii MF-1]